MAQYHAAERLAKRSRTESIFLRHDAAVRRYPDAQVQLTDRLTSGVRAALVKAGLPEPDDCAWEVPRQAEHGDYATNAPMVLARAAKRAPKQIADLIVKNFPPMPEVERLEVAGPGFINVFLTPACEVIQSAAEAPATEHSRATNARAGFCRTGSALPMASRSVDTTSRSPCQAARLVAGAARRRRRRSNLAVARATARFFFITTRWYAGTLMRRCN